MEKTGERREETGDRMGDVRTVLVAATALGVDQISLQGLFDALPGTRKGVKIRRLLVVDTFDGIFDLAQLARHVDYLDFSMARRGFALAKRCCCSAAEALGADFLVLVDGDGQFSAKDIMTVVDTRIGNPSSQLILPQRSAITLLVPGDLPYDRVLAERFENYCMLNATGRDDMFGRDLQAGIRGLAPRAWRIVMEKAVSMGFSWDLESLGALLDARLSATFVQVEVKEQALSMFTAADSYRNIAVLAQRIGSENIVRYFDEFASSENGYSPEEIEAYRSALTLILQSA